MKQFYGSDLSPYSQEQRAVINEATRYEIWVYRIFLLWAVTLMTAGVLCAYRTGPYLTTNELIALICLIWGVSGLPFFVLRDIVVRKFAPRLPKPAARERLEPFSLPELLFRLLAGFFMGTWATHVMIVYLTVKHFQLVAYSRQLSAK